MPWSLVSGCCVMASTSAGDKVEKALSDVRRFAVDVLPRVTTASNLDERSVERSFALARRVKRTLRSASFRQRLETAGKGSAAPWGERYSLQQLTDAPKTLYLAVLDNPRRWLMQFSVLFVSVKNFIPDWNFRRLGHLLSLIDME